MSTAQQLLLFCAFAMILTQPKTAAGAQQGSTTSPKLVERVDFDCNHSGELTTFSLFGHPSREEPTGAYRLVVKRKDGQRWTFSNQGDAWIPVANRNLKRQNLVPSSKRMLFISAGEGPATQIYLILIGAGSSCCVGSLDVLTAGSDGLPRVVFHSKEHLLAAVVPQEDQIGIELIGQSSDSEAWALKNAQSYDPYRAYLITGAESAQYNLELSKAYTEAHYCEWHGPNYDERFVAVGKRRALSNVEQCRKRVLNNIAYSTKRVSGAVTRATRAFHLDDKRAAGTVASPSVRYGDYTAK